MPTDDDLRIRIKARETAAAIVDLAKQEAENLPHAVRPVFYEEIARRLDVKFFTPPSPAAAPFTDAQARAWGATRIQFGMHAGKRIDEIPLSYLEKLAEPNDFVRHLRRYLASHRIALEEELAAQRGIAVEPGRG
jgi:hypothetical protein